MVRFRAVSTSICRWDHVVAGGGYDHVGTRCRTRAICRRSGRRRQYLSRLCIHLTSRCSVVTSGAQRAVVRGGALRTVFQGSLESPPIIPGPELNSRRICHLPSARRFSNCTSHNCTIFKLGSRARPLGLDRLPTPLASGLLPPAVF
jgi:hypothetical protein